MTKDELIREYRLLTQKVIDLGMSGGVECGCRTQEDMDNPDGEWLCKMHNDDGDCCKMCDLIHFLAELGEVSPE